MGRGQGLQAGHTHQPGGWWRGPTAPVRGREGRNKNRLYQSFTDFKPPQTIPRYHRHHAKEGTSGSDRTHNPQTPGTREKSGPPSRGGLVGWCAVQHLPREGVAPTPRIVIGREHIPKPSPGKIIFIVIRHEACSRFMSDSTRPTEPKFLENYASIQTGVQARMLPDTFRQKKIRGERP